MERWISLTAPLTRTRATMSNTELTQIEGALNTANCNNMVVNCPFVYSTTGLENSRTTPTSGLDLESSGSRTGGTLPGENTYGSTVSATKNGTQSSISSALSQGVSLSCNHTAICCNVFFYTAFERRQHSTNFRTFELQHWQFKSKCCAARRDFERGCSYGHCAVRYRPKQTNDG